MTLATTVTHFDTDDHRLYRHGLSLTRHIGGWTLITPDGDVQVPSTPGLDEVPHDLCWLLRAFTRGDDLIPIPDIAQPAPITAPLPDPSARGVVLAYLRAQLEAIAVADLAVRRDEHDAVHRMRVAVRRVRSVLETYAAILDARRTVGAFVGELRWLISRLDAAGEAEVQWDRVHRRVRSLPPRFVTGVAELRIDQYFGCLAEETGATVFERLDSERYLRLLNALDVLETVLREEPRTTWPKAARRPVGKALPPLIGDVVRLAGRRARQVFATADPAGRDEAVHSFGKTVKRLRYAVEAAAPTRPEAAERSLTGLRQLQDLLGEHQNAVVARRHLRVLQDTAADAGETEFTYGLLYQQETEAADSSVRCLALSWHSFREQQSPLWT